MKLRLYRPFVVICLLLILFLQYLQFGCAESTSPGLKEPLNLVDTVIKVRAESVRCRDGVFFFTQPTVSQYHRGRLTATLKSEHGIVRTLEPGKMEFTGSVQYMRMKYRDKATKGE